MIVGAYAAALPGEPVIDLVAALATDDRVSGLELPTHHLLDPQIREGLGTVIPGSWTISLTSFPETMMAANTAERNGLASSDESVQLGAVDRIGDIIDAATTFAAEGGWDLQEVFLHSAPRGGHPEALQSSLTALLDRFADGPALTVEHCDANVGSHQPEKGFLSLEAELAVLQEFSGRVGVVINWARSALEGRSADTAVRHLEMASVAGLLRRVMFSGVAATATEYGPAWSDAHLPLSSTEPASLLTPELVAAALAACPTGIPTGVKFSVRPISADTQTRAGIIGAGLAAISAAQLSDGQVDNRVGDR